MLIWFFIRVLFFFFANLLCCFKAVLNAAHSLTSCGAPDSCVLIGALMDPFKGHVWNTHTYTQLFVQHLSIRKKFASPTSLECNFRQLCTISCFFTFSAESLKSRDTVRFLVDHILSCVTNADSSPGAWLHRQKCRLWTGWPGLMFWGNQKGETACLGCLSVKRATNLSEFLPYF